jgi:hypothetical protein
MRIARLLVLALTACGSSSSPSVMDAPPTGDTWTSWAESFTMKYCSATCHSPTGSGAGGGVYDFTQYSNVFANRAMIRCGVSATALSDCTGFPPPKQFPIAAPYPTDPERARLVAWVGAGAPQ